MQSRECPDRTGILKCSKFDQVGASRLDQADRAQYFHALRALGPVVKLTERNNPELGSYFLTRRDDILQAARDPDTFAQDWGTMRLVTASGKPIQAVPMSCRPEEHPRFASLLHRLFAPGSVNPYEAPIRTQAAALIDAIAPMGRTDAVGVAHLWPCQAFWAAMGLPLEHCTARMVDLMYAVTQWDVSSQVELLGLLAEMIVEGSLNSPRPPGLLWRLLDDLEAGDFTIDEIIAVLLTVFGGATLGVKIGVSYALWRLARYPRLRAQLRGNPQQIEAFV